MDADNFHHEAAKMNNKNARPPTLAPLRLSAQTPMGILIDDDDWNRLLQN